MNSVILYKQYPCNEHEKCNKMQAKLSENMNMGGYQALIDNDYPKAQFCSRDLSIYVMDYNIHNHTTVPLVPIRTWLILDM